MLKNLEANSSPLLVADGNLGEYIPGDWGEWSACQGGIQTRHRSCQVYPPVYSRLNSSYQLSDTKKCGENGVFYLEQVPLQSCYCIATMELRFVISFDAQVRLAIFKRKGCIYLSHS